MPDAPHGTRGNGNQTVTTTSRYREPTPVDQRGRGYGYGDRGHLRDDLSKGSTTHGARVEGTRHKHYGDFADHGPHRSHANGAVLQQPQHHVHGPRYPIHGHHANDVWYGKQAGEGDGHKRGHPVEVMHGHFGDVLRVPGGYEHGTMHFNDHKRGNVGDHMNGGRLGRHNIEHFGGHRFNKHFDGAGHGNIGSAWRTHATSAGSGVRGKNQHDRPAEPPGPYQHVDDLHRNVAKFGTFARGQYGHSGADADSAGPNAAYRELDGHGFPRLLQHDHKFSNPAVYGYHRTGGYQVQENVADFDGMTPTAAPQPHPATTAQAFQVDHNYPSPASGIGGGGDTLDGMSSVSAIASPPTVNNVYYTLDPVVPYNDVALQPQRERLFDVGTPKTK